MKHECIIQLGTIWKYQMHTNGIRTSIPWVFFALIDTGLRLHCQGQNYAEQTFTLVWSTQ